jgi:hypothetical protein
MIGLLLPLWLNLGGSGGPGPTPPHVIARGFADVLPLEIEAVADVLPLASNGFADVVK